MANEISTQERLRQDYNSSVNAEPKTDIQLSAEKENESQFEEEFFGEIPEEDIVKRGLLNAGIDYEQKETSTDRFPICKHCCFHTIFKHDGEDPIFKKGIWVKTGNGICTRHHSLDMQNNRGIWYICDTKTARNCHLYEAK